MVMKSAVVVGLHVGMIA